MNNGGDLSTFHFLRPVDTTYLPTPLQLLMESCLLLWYLLPCIRPRVWGVGSTYVHVRLSQDIH